MIKVYIRYVEEVKGTLLGEFMPEDLPRLIDSIENFDIYLGELGGIDKKEVAGQYVVWDNEAYFELVIIPED